jgi:hypothetical protein
MWAGAVVVLVALGIAAAWFLGRSEPVEVVPPQPDEAAEEPQQPDEAAEELQQPDEAAEEPRQPDEAAPETVYGQEPRANWDVTGVAGWDRLNVRAGPGVHNDVKAALAADAVELESTGRIAHVDGVLWREIVVPGDGTGWVHAGYLTETAPPGLDDGRHAAYLHSISTGERTITVDVIRFLTGQEAIEAYHAEFPDDPAGPPNDYWIANVDPSLRTVPVSADVVVSLVRLAEDGDADLDPGSWEALPDYLSGQTSPDDDRLSSNPFWLVVSDGVVTRIEEQYTP